MPSTAELRRQLPPPRTLLVFVDGLGLGEPDPHVNPIESGACPTLARWLRRAVAVDARLDVPGLPQSATGQAALYTGLNAAAHMGRHVEGMPGPRLRALVERHNLFGELLRRGYTATFANAFFTDDPEEVRRRRRVSVTTAAALSAFGAVRDRRALLAGRAVYHDLTRTALRPRGYDGPLLAPETAAAHLRAIARTHDFTLFEFFESDLVAHRGERKEIEVVLRKLDRFLTALRPWIRLRRGLLVLTSDHGNIEDASTRRHTLNPVPLVAFGHGATALLARVRRLDEFAPALLALYPPRATSGDIAGRKIERRETGVPGRS